VGREEGKTVAKEAREQKSRHRGKGSNPYRRRPLRGFFKMTSPERHKNFFVCRNRKLEAKVSLPDTARRTSSHARMRGLRTIVEGNSFLARKKIKKVEGKQRSLGNRPCAKVKETATRFLTSLQGGKRKSSAEKESRDWVGGDSIRPYFQTGSDKGRKKGGINSLGERRGGRGEKYKRGKQIGCCPMDPEGGGKSMPQTKK